MNDLQRQGYDDATLNDDFKEELKDNDDYMEGYYLGLKYNEMKRTVE